MRNLARSATERLHRHFLNMVHHSRTDSQPETPTSSRMSCSWPLRPRRKNVVTPWMPNPRFASLQKILTMLPKAAEAYRQQIERGLDDDPRAAAKARVILRDLLGPIQMCPGKDGDLWAQYHTRPAALIKSAVGASVELSGSGGPIAPLCASAAPCPGRADLSGYGNAKSLVETRRLGRLHTNSQVLVAGAGFEPATFGL